MWTWLGEMINRVTHWNRRNSLQNSRKNIHEHYDLSNDFFSTFLDSTMAYSSALFENPQQDLEAAQLNKIHRLLKLARLTPEHHLLEIGCGWGRLAIEAARIYGCKVTGITLSQEQLTFAQQQVKAAGLADKIELKLCDYRNLTGSFDRIISVEMLEAVGDRYVDGYFAKIDELLHPHGLLGLQAILCPDNQYPILRDGVDFIQKHVFPGSLLMCNARITQAMMSCGELNLHEYEDMGPHYALTLQRWAQQFESRLDEVRALGFDDTFIRKWRYYLCYCEAAFATRHITVAQMVYSRPDNFTIPSQIYHLIPPR
jgi:cyclopropane-fatty-acyl-phospholipid synthase